MAKKKKKNDWSKDLPIKLQFVLLFIYVLFYSSSIETGGGGGEEGITGSSLKKC